MKRKTIVLASILKPIDDPRMYEKIGSSLCHKYDVHIIGHKSVNQPKSTIQFHPIFDLSSSKKSRRLAGFTFLKKLRAIQPDLVIVHTPELLWFALFYKFQSGTKFIYDVRENYWRNIIYQNNYIGLRKWILALGVRFTELSVLPFVSSIFLAEKCYYDEVLFFRKKSTILENKFQNNLELKPKQTPSILKVPIKAICMGTLSEVYGIDRAIKWVVQLRKLGYEISLQLVGKIATDSMSKTIAFYTDKHEFIELVGDGSLIPHDEIINALYKADIAILPYQPNKSTQNCIPTKMYECLALNIPMIVQKNSLWESICKPINAAVFLNFELESAEDDLNRILEQSFYNESKNEKFFWGEEKMKMLKKIQNLFY